MRNLKVCKLAPSLSLFFYLIARNDCSFRILEVNGKLVVGAGRSDLARLLAVAPDAAQIVVLRKGESLTALRTLRSDNLRLTHRIGYLEEQVRDLLAPSRAEQVPADPPPTRQEQVQVTSFSFLLNNNRYLKDMREEIEKRDPCFHFRVYSSLHSRFFKKGHR